MKLNSLFSGFSLVKKKKVLGRGIGSGKGKTSGKGHKGQRARSGAKVNGFEGGQQSIFTRLPKRGFKSLNVEKKMFVAVNLSKIDSLLNSCKIVSGTTIDKNLLFSLGIISSLSKKVKVLGKSGFGKELVVCCEAASASARNSVTFMSNDQVEG